jgi:hypothetical protein
MQHACGSDLRLLELAGCGARGGIRTLDLSITGRSAPSSRCHPGRFLLLMSMGSSVECDPDQRRYGRRNGHEKNPPDRPDPLAEATYPLFAEL